MLALLIVSLLWAFSFPLVKVHLVGLEPGLVGAIRLGLSCLVFLPLLRRPPGGAGDAIRLAALGALQFGVMYVAYIAAFQHLLAWEVALLTVLTPLYVVLIADILERRFRPLALGAAALAVLGAATLTWGRPAGDGFRAGFLLVQISNVAFAAGQVAWARYARARPGLRAASVFGWLYLGGALVAGLFALARWQPGEEISSSQALVLLYLGVVASGFGFFLWNKGAASTSPGVLAVMNDAKIPLAMGASILVFNEAAEPGRLALGSGLVLLALLLAHHFGERGQASSAPVRRDGGRR